MEGVPRTVQVSAAPAVPAPVRLQPRPAARPQPPPPPDAARIRWPVRGPGLALAGLIVALVVAWAVFPTYPVSDGYYHLVWARELLDGQTPSFANDAASTPHPGLILLAVVLEVVAGGSADRVLVLVSVLALALLIWSVYDLAARVFDRLTGVLAAIFAGSSLAFALLAFIGSVDVLFLATVTAAGALEARRPRRGREVMGLLVVAGLFRPEGWALGGLYWLWCGVGRRDLALMMLAAPLTWSAVDLMVTGDPLFSVRHTSSFAQDIGRERGIKNVPIPLITGLIDATKAPVFLAALYGIVLAWRRRASLPTLYVPSALLLTGILVFVATGAAGLSIIPRYLLAPALALGMFGAYGVASFGRRGVLAVAAGALVFVPLKSSSIELLRDELRVTRQSHRQLTAIAADRAAFRCPAISVPTYRLTPDLRYALHDDVRVVPRAPLDPTAPDVVDPPSGAMALYVTAGGLAESRLGLAGGVPASTNRLPRGAVGRRFGLFTLVDRCSG